MSQVLTRETATSKSMGTGPYPGTISSDFLTEYDYDDDLRLKSVTKPAIQTEVGTLTRPVVLYDWEDDQLVTTTDELGKDTTYEYDELGRLIRTTYPDTTTEETWYKNDNQVFKKNRIGVVDYTYYDNAGRVTQSYGAYGKALTILDGSVDQVAPLIERDVVLTYYYPGWTQPRYQYRDLHIYRPYYDYRGRMIQENIEQANKLPNEESVGYFRKYYSFYKNRLFKTQTLKVQNVNGQMVSASTYEYKAYSANALQVRKIIGDISLNLTGDVNQALLFKTRPDLATINPAFEIVDAFHNELGDLAIMQGTDEIETHYEYDELGRQTAKHLAYGTNDQFTTTTEYDPWGRKAAMTTPHSSTEVIRNESLYDPAGNVIESKVVGAQGGEQITRFTFDRRNRTKKTIRLSSDGDVVTEQFYKDCCGNVRGTRNALGHGTIAKANAEGQVIHQVTIADFDTQYPNNVDDPATDKTMAEVTSRYNLDGTLKFQTRWAEDPGPVFTNSPNVAPIAGLDGVPLSKGVTTQYLYSKYISAAQGIPHEDGQIITPLHQDSANRVTIAPALAKLAENEANGGMNYAFKAYSNDGSASVVISPDEKTMSVEIMDGTGRTIMNATMTGPRLGFPQSLIDWTCHRSMVPMTEPGYSNVQANRTIESDGVTIDKLVNGTGKNIGIVDQAGYKTLRDYDVSGNVVKTTDARGNESSFAFDALRRKTSVTNAMNVSSSTTYDEAGRVASVTDLKGNTTNFYYDEFGRLSQVVDRLGQTTTREYNDRNLLTTIKDAELKETLYGYDLLGQRKIVVVDDGSETNYEFDAAGRMATMTFESGKKRVFDYALSGVLNEIEYFDGLTPIGVDDYSYDQYLRRDGSDSRDNVIRTKSYNDRGLLEFDTTTYGGQSYVVEYQYDPKARLAKLVYPSGTEIEYGYTARDFIETIHVDGIPIQTNEYNEVGALAEVDRGQGPLETRTYNQLNLVETINNQNVGTATYTYDGNNNKVSETWDTTPMSNYNFSTVDPSGQFADGYDAENRFRTFSQLGQPQSFDRDNIGNITARAMYGNVFETRGYSDLHELTNINSDTQQFDDDGNVQLSRTGLQLFWDGAGLLEKSSPTGSPDEIEYGYDSDRKRVWKTVSQNGALTTDRVFIYAGSNCIADYVSGAVATSPAQEYVFANSIDSLQMIIGPNGQKLCVTRNQQWSPTALVDFTSGNVVERYAYDVFGKRTVMDGSGTQLSQSAYGNRYGYTSREIDLETGLMYFRARMYDCETGEFLSRDPMEFIDGMSLYRGYTNLDAVDPTGTVGYQANFVTTSRWRGTIDSYNYLPFWPGFQYKQTYQEDWTIKTVFNFICDNNNVSDFNLNSSRAALSGKYRFEYRPANPQPGWTEYKKGTYDDTGDSWTKPSTYLLSNSESKCPCGKGILISVTGEFGQKPMTFRGRKLSAGGSIGGGIPGIAEAGVAFDSSGKVKIKGKFRGFDIGVNLSYSETGGLGSGNPFLIKSRYRDVYQLCCNKGEPSLKKYRGEARGDRYREGSKHTELPGFMPSELQNTKFSKPKMSASINTLVYPNGGVTK